MALGIPVAIPVCRYCRRSSMLFSYALPSRTNFDELMGYRSASADMQPYSLRLLSSHAMPASRFSAKLIGTRTLVRRRAMLPMMRGMGLLTTIVIP